MSTNELKGIIRFRIHQGQEDRFMAVVDDCCRLVHHHEPGVTSYEWFLDVDDGTCTLLDSFASSEAVVAHLQGPVATELLPQLLEVADIERVDFFGVPTNDVLIATAEFKAVHHGHAFATARL